MLFPPLPKSIYTTKSTWIFWQLSKLPGCILLPKQRYLHKRRLRSKELRWFKQARKQRLRNKTTNLKIKSNPSSNPKKYFRETALWFCSGSADCICTRLLWTTGRPLPGMWQFFYRSFSQICISNLEYTYIFYCKASIVNVPNSYNHKNILIALLFLRKVMNTCETWKC